MFLRPTSPHIYITTLSCERVRKGVNSCASIRLFAYFGKVDAELGYTLCDSPGASCVSPWCCLKPSRSSYRLPEEHLFCACKYT